ncbi:MAG: SCO family protein [Cryomorphaceae bacterium]|nr:SCO family protein [Cryomorphaceae bacterium]
MSKTFRKWAILVSILILPFFLYYIWVYNIREVFFTTLEFAGPPEITAEGDTLPYTIPQFDGYVNQDGFPIDRSFFDERITVVNFFFSTCPSVCGPMNFQLYDQIYNRFKHLDDFRILSFTVDPETDTESVLAEYAKSLGVVPRKIPVWNFVNGDKEATYKLANAFLLSAMEDEMAPGGFLHSEMLVLVDWEGRIRSRTDEHGNIIGVYNSLELHEVKDMIDDIKVLKAEFEKEKSRREYQKELEEKEKARQQR